MQLALTRILLNTYSNDFFENVKAATDLLLMYAS